jgi:phage tail P2-like protein
MIKLNEAKITDALPRIVSAQPWVQALSAALFYQTGQLLDFAEQSQIYTNIDAAPEKVLDALAVQLKVEWYDSSAALDVKRTYIKTALSVQKHAGTAYAMRETIQTVLPHTELVEWFNAEGDAPPGTFDLITTDCLTPEIAAWVPNMLAYTKNARSHLRRLTVRSTAPRGSYLAVVMRCTKRVQIANTLSGSGKARGTVYSGVTMHCTRRMQIANTTRYRGQAKGAVYNGVTMRMRPGTATVLNSERNRATATIKGTAYTGVATLYCGKTTIVGGGSDAGI